MASQKIPKEKAVFLIKNVEAGFSGTIPLIFTNTRLIMIHAGIGDTGFSFDMATEADRNEFEKRGKEWGAETENFLAKKGANEKVEVFPAQKFPLDLFLRLSPKDEKPLSFVLYDSIKEVSIKKNFIGVVTITIVAGQTYKFTTSATLDELEQTIGILFPGKFKRI